MKKSLVLKFVAFVVFTAMTTNALAQRDKRKKTDTQLNQARLLEAETIFTEGEKYFMLEDYAKALFCFQRAVEKNPDNGTIYYKTAEAYTKGNKEEDLLNAAENIEHALRLEKKNKYFYLLASNIYSNLRQFDKAAQALETMIKEVKGTEEYLYELASIYYFSENLDDAIKVYNRAESIMGINEVSSLQKQRIYLIKGKVNEAIAEGEKLIRTFPDEERYVLGLAETLSQMGRGAKAIEYIEQYIREHPDAGSAKMLLAGFYRDSGQEQKSRDYVMEVFDDLSLEVNSKILMLSTYNVILSQRKSKKTEDAGLEAFVLSLFKKLEDHYPEDPSVHIVGGDLFMTLAKNEESKREYLLAIRKGAKSFEVWQNLLYLESQSNALDSMIVHSEQALELFPNQGMIYYFNGFAYLRKKDYAQAAMALEQAKKVSASNPGLVNEINGLLGDTYQGSREYDKSNKAYDEALAFNPNNDLILNNYSYYLALRKSDLEKAERMSSLLIKNHPDNASYLDTHAWVLFARQKYKEAKKVIEKAIATGKASSAHYEHYGDILFQLGDTDNAVLQWQKAKSMNQDNELINKKIENRRIY